MKILSIKSTVIAASAMLFATGCNDLTDGFSTDPVNITDPSVISSESFLTGAEVGLIGAYEGDINRLTGMWSGYFSGEDRQYIGLGNYAVSGRDFNGEWAAVYSSVLKNTQIVKSRAHVAKNYRALGMAQVMEAMSYGLAADLWGDVPFSEAVKYPAITEPKFDGQSSVYNAVQVLLDSAIANLALPVPAAFAASNDVFFGGDDVAWTKVANTLKARYYLHVRDYDNAAIYSDAALGIDDPSSNMMAPHGPVYLQSFNLYYSFTTYDRPGYMGADSYAPKLMDPAEAESRNNDKTNEEARLNYYYFPGGGLNFASIAYEPNVLADFDWGSGEGYDGFFGGVTSFPLVTYEENTLIRAEALAKSGDFTGALASLNELRAYYDAGGYWSAGYNDDFEHLYEAYDAGDFAPGGIENADNKTPIDALIREIIEERYVTLIGQLEGYNDIRRTDNLLGIPVKVGSPSIPQRLLYPQSELNTNKNVPTAGLFDATPANNTAY
ncbi:MAG TPA: SusD/RagB family nutrient-binding outer membrane lipoprotein [Cyclobacteriaceae bacterium]|nr:SusD/RagB family nutrient-binding outer membrane lipoprotein [Cyclobacteriaceae bacterium]